jgi:hypothetical protein
MSDNNRLSMSARPREPDDFPTLNAWFTTSSDGYMVGGYKFIQLLTDLKGSNRFLERWRQDRSPEENLSASGIDPIVDQDEYLRFRKSLGEKSNDSFSLSAYAYSTAIFPTERQRESAVLGYRGGITMASNTMWLQPPITMGSHNLTLQEWVDVMRVIIRWRVPKFLAVGSANYETYDRVFDHRAWPGWMAWFPIRISPQSLPRYALTFDIGEGTLVASQETNVITTDPAQVERSREVEIALAQFGVLPTLDELTGQR